MQVEMFVLLEVNFIYIGRNVSPKFLRFDEATGQTVGMLGSRYLLKVPKIITVRIM